MFPSKHRSTSTFIEICESVNRCVLFVECFISNNCCLCLAYDRENVGLAIVISVCSNTEVALLGIFVGEEASCERQNWICWGSNYVLELVVED